MDIHNDNRPNCGVTVCALKIIDGEINVLCYKRKGTELFNGQYSLPNGFVNIHDDSDTDVSAIHALEAKAGSQSHRHIEQLKTYSGAGIDPRKWSVVVSYLCLNADAGSGEYIKLSKALKLNLAFNHNEILSDGVARLVSKAEHTNISAKLLDNEFTLTELQEAYEILLNSKLDKSTFRGNIKESDFLEDTGEMSSGKGRKAKLYRLKNNQLSLFYPQSLKKHCKTLTKRVI